jgi:hypothetical protein
MLAEAVGARLIGTACETRPWERGWTWIAVSRGSVPSASTATHASVTAKGDAITHHSLEYRLKLAVIQPQKHNTID